MKKPSLAIILGKLKAGGKSEPDEPEEMEEDDSDSEVSETEVDAMRMFMKASSPESKAEALKMFLKACGAY